MRRFTRKRINNIIEANRTTAWMSASDALDRINESGMKMSAPTLLKLIKTGEIAGGKKVGVRWFVPVSSIEKLVSKSTL